MTKTDFFRVVIKIFGLFCLIEALFQLIPNISFSRGSYTFSIVASSLYLVITALIAFILLFQTNKLIELFQLNKGFDTPNIDTKYLNENGLLQLGLIIIGLLLLVNNMAQFLNFCYLLFKEQVSAKGLDEVSGIMLSQQMDFNWGILSGLNVLISLLMLTNYKRISKLFL